MLLMLSWPLAGAIGWWFIIKESRRLTTSDILFLIPCMCMGYVLIIMGLANRYKERTLIEW